MTPLKQCDSRWGDKQLGTCGGDNICYFGCFITSLAMLANIRPDEVNDILTQEGGYAQGCHVISDIAADLLGLEYNGKTYSDPHEICIAETDYYSPSTPQHFFIWLGNGFILDPLIGYETINNYPIKSYRLFKPKGDNMGFDENHMRNLLTSNFRVERQTELGSVDEAGLKADVDFRYAQISKDSSITAFGDQYTVYKNAKDNKWMLKTDCQKEKQALITAYDKNASLYKDEIADLNKKLEAEYIVGEKLSDDLNICNVNFKTCQTDLADKPVVCDVVAPTWEMWVQITKDLIKNWLK